MIATAAQSRRQLLQRRQRSLCCIHLSNSDQRGRRRLSFVSQWLSATCYRQAAAPALQQQQHPNLSAAVLLFSSIQFQQPSSISAVSGSASRAAASHPSSVAARAGAYRQLELYPQRSCSGSLYAAVVAATSSAFQRQQLWRQTQQHLRRFSVSDKRLHPQRHACACGAFIVNSSAR